MLRRNLVFQTPFSPVNFSPAIWLDASDGSTMYQERTGVSATTLVASDGDPIGTWRDKSGNARHVTASSDAKRPTYKVATHNGRSSIYFDGVNDNFIITSSILSGMSGYSIFMVRQWEVPGVTGVIFAGSNNTFEYVAVLAGSVTGRRSYISAGNYGSTATLSLSSSVVSLIYDGTKSNNATRLVRRTNGAQDALSFAGTIPATSEAHTSITIGSLTDSANWFKGYILEIVVLSSTATADKISQMERYLAAKWGITLS
jgi:hypothetical protein